MSRKNQIIRALLVSLFVLLIGCGYEEVASGLNQSQANEIVATLAEQGITALARKGRGGKSNFGVQVKAEYYTIAVQILHAFELPRDQKSSFSELTQPKGIIPNTREVEAVRLDYALAVEIEEKLRAIPAINNVKVIVRSNIIKAGQEPSAAVIISEHPGTAVDTTEVSKIIELMVPDVRPSRIKISLSKETAKGATIANQGISNNSGKIVSHPLVRFLKFFQVPEKDYLPLTYAFVIFFVVTIVVGFFVGFVVGRYDDSIRKFLSKEPGFDPRPLGISEADRLKLARPEGGDQSAPGGLIGDS